LRAFAGKILGILTLVLLVPACGVGGGASTFSPTVAPGAPGQVKAVGGNGRVTLSWVALGSGESFTVLRSQTPGGPYFPISVASGFVAPTRYVDRGLSNDTKYYYVVTASNAFGQSATSPEVTGAPGFKPLAIESGSASYHTLALFEDGSVWAGARTPPARWPRVISAARTLRSRSARFRTLSA
jgi:hypothetical protein